MVFSAETAQSVLKSGDFGHICKPNSIFYNVMRPFLGNSLLLHEGQLWRDRRKIIMRCMSFHHLRTYTSLLNKHSKRIVNDLGDLFADGKSHRINTNISGLFVAIITEIVTGSDIEGAKGGAEFHHNFQKWKTCIIKRLEKIWLHPDILWKFSSHKIIHDQAVSNISAFSRQKLMEHKQRREEKSVKFRNTIDELIDSGQSDEEIVRELHTLLSGGHEMSATTMHLFLLLMATHQNYQDLCRKEIDAIFEDEEQSSNGSLKFEAINRLKYLEMCLMETMRLLPPVFAFMRQLKTGMDIEYEGKEIHVPPGTQVAIVPWAIHRNENYWSNPETFDPDRFLPEECAKRHSHAYLPFSAGPRNCFGMKLGMNEMKVVAAHVLRNFRVESTDRLEDIPLLPTVTVTPERDYNFVMRKRAL
ncbi:unnamed protein product [Orchesella dallaii]|uniref:Cytochrome P450 4C1 n=1 Tax=Orchesella dallaii TaxID=48710 RepID=A0ABP1RGT5_9HEXA